MDFISRGPFASRIDAYLIYIVLDTILSRIRLKFLFTFQYLFKIYFHMSMNAKKVSQPSVGQQQDVEKNNDLHSVEKKC